jgi:hypothetical protein
MPVIEHQALVCDADAVLVTGLGQNRFKRGIVGGLFKQEEPSDPTVQDMISTVSGSKTVPDR